MIKAIIFDCYGVLVTDSWLPFKKKYFSHSQDLMDQATDLNKQCDRGMIGYEDFIKGLSLLAGISASEVAKTIENNSANQDLFALIKELKSTYKIAMLSNVGSDVLKDLFSDEELGLFDDTCLSYETGYIKPDPRAYQISATRLGVDTNECVLIDDLERNCTAAQDEGMKAIWYKDFDQASDELKALLNTKD